MSAAADVNIFNKDGSVSVYKKLSERLPDFLEKYPVGDGYRLISSSQEYLSLTPKLSQLAEMLIEKGSPLEEIQKVVSLSSVLFTCELRDESNELVSSANALKKISQYKDYETGETAALQRLLAKLGFGGEVFDDDESSDFEDQNLSTQPTKEPESTPARVHSLRTEPKSAVSIAPDSSTSANVNASNIAPALMRQLQRQAEMAGVACPNVTTSAEAKAALKKIRSS